MATLDSRTWESDTFSQSFLRLFVANGSGVQCIRHLKGFADSDDAVQSTAVEAEDTVSTTDRDLFLVHIYLKKEQEKKESLDEVIILECVVSAPQPHYLYSFFITGHFMVFDPWVGNVVGHVGESNLTSTHTSVNDTNQPAIHPSNYPSIKP